MNPRRFAGTNPSRYGLRCRLDRWLRFGRHRRHRCSANRRPPPPTRLTSGAFVAMWRDRVDTLYARYPAANVNAAAAGSLRSNSL
jgi:hypothetical protein